MRILFTRFPLESALGGAEIQTLSLMKGLSKHGHEVSFLGSCPILLKGVADYGLRITELDIGNPPVTKWNAISFFWRKAAMKKKLIRSLSTYHLPLSTIVMLSLSEKLLLTEAAVKNGIKVFWIEHDSVGPWLTKNPWLPTLKKLSEKVTTICVSELSRKIYIDLGWKPSTVIAIPNGIDVGWFKPPPPNPLPPAGERGNSSSPSPSASRTSGGGGGRGEGVKLGCVARLSREKGVDLLINAVTDLPNVSLTIVGTGPEEARLHSLLSTIQPSNHLTTPRIQILPTIPDIASFYHSIDALVLPSRENDPFGLVAAEAMACGTPVIVTDQCGIAGYLKDEEDTIIAKADSVDALKKAIVHLQDTAVRGRIATAGRISAEKKFSEKTMIENYEQLLKTR
ncbi:glycosyltransferase family 1 protein [Candidatus Peribacteria bacterium]|nr:glycosyltransferase family 1 protein [Candidatus Peribacteria bacterium]